MCAAWPLLKGSDMKKIAIAFCLVSSLALSACNTIAGFGKDVETVGGALEEAADDAKN